MSEIKDGFVNEAPEQTAENQKWLETVQKSQERLQKEYDILINRWDKTNLLLKIESDYAKGIVAVCLENQRLINESMTDSGDIAQFKRVSIPLVRRVYDPRCFVAWDIVSIQVLLGPAGIVIGRQARKLADLYAEDIAARTKKLKVVFPTPLGLALESDEATTTMDIRKPYSLDEEAAMLAQVAVEICEEFSREIIQDLRNNVGTVATSEWQDAAKLWDHFDELGGTINVKIGEYPNWIVAHPDMVKLLKDSARETDVWTERTDGFYMQMAVKRTGTLTRHGRLLTVIEDEQFPKNEVLVGYKGGDHVAGYAYVPYVPFTRTPVVLDPETFTPRVGILTRYAKKLLLGGSKFYGRLVVNNLPIKEEKTDEQ